MRSDQLQNNNNVAAVEETPRAELGTSLLSLILSSIKITLSFFLSRLLSTSLFPQPQLPPSARRREKEKDNTLRGTITLVTGSNVGIGYEIAKEHLQRGSHVILACRNEGKAKQAKRKMIEEVLRHNQAQKRGEIDIGKKEGAKEEEEKEEEEDDVEDRVEVALLDCSSLQNVRQFVETWKKDTRRETGKEAKRTIDYLYLNAGIADKPIDSDRFTEEGLELVYVTNHLGPFLLCALLSPYFSPSVRIILTSSAAAFFASFSSKENIDSKKKDHPQSGVEAGFHVPLFGISKGAAGGVYSQSKAMQIIFSNQLQQKFDRARQEENKKKKTGTKRKISASFHPGYVATNIFKALNIQAWWTGVAASIFQGTALTPKQGAQTALWLGLANRGFQPGAFYDRSNLITLPFYSTLHSRQIDEALWNRWTSDAGLQESDWHF